MKFVNVLKEGAQYLEDLRQLYESAFPELEKKPFSRMEELSREGKMRMFALIDEDRFVGLAICMESGSLALLDYFAIHPDFRCYGYGGKAVRELLEEYQGKRFIFEIEIQDEHADNAVDRRRRKDFYLRNGLKETGVFVNLFHVDFELITPDGKVTFEEYKKILTDVLGEEMVKTLDPRDCTAKAKKDAFPK